MKPFRWDIAKREQLGRLVESESTPPYSDFMQDLRQCAARVIAFAGDSELVFVGRSPESIFDYLSGAFLESPRHQRLNLANISIRFNSVETVGQSYPSAIPAVKDHFAAIGLSPHDIVAKERPIALVDLVATGSTFENLSKLIVSWAESDRADVPAMRNKMRFVGITWRTKTSPNTYRWQQHADWLTDFSNQCVKNVSVPGRFWDYLGNKQPKVGWSNPPSRWPDPAISEPPRGDRNLEALGLALTVFDTANTARERDRFADELRKQPPMDQPWFRSVVGELRKRR